MGDEVRNSIEASLRVLVALVLLSSCAGYVPDRTPGGDVYLEDGALGVDPRNENTYLLRRVPDSERGPSLFAVSPDSSEVRLVSNLTGFSDVRLLFTASGAMILATLVGRDRAMIFDRDTLGLVRERDLPARYGRTRTSPSGRFVAMADDDALHAPIHILDTETLETEVVPHDGDWLEIQWLHRRDQLLAVVVYGMDATPSVTPGVRILGWNAEDIAASVRRPDPNLDVSLPNTTVGYAFSSIGVSPDDRYAVLPVLQRDTPDDAYEYRLVVLDLVTLERRVVPDAQGPVGFTADGTTLVSYRYALDETDVRTARLLTIDLESLAVTEIDPPGDGAPHFFVTREGHWVLLSLLREEEGEDLSTSVLYDLSTGATTLLGRYVALGEHVSRLGAGEVWVVDSAGLTRIPLMSGELEPIPLSFVPMHLNVLPAHDRLVMDDEADPHAIRFFDPASRAVSSLARLPAF